MKNLTTSIYDFEKLRKADYLYVDKTEYIWHLIDPPGESYFLSRPRRFGKSLLVSTLEAICEALDCQPGDILEYDRSASPD